jgi:thiamine biosynthesis lipoprotein
MNFHDNQSELFAFNESPLKTWIPIRPDFALVLKLSLDLQRQSSGVFNVAVGDFQFLNRPGFEVRRHKKTFQARRVLPIKINLGGIAKGYAVDQAVKILKKNGFESGCVNAGGDLKIFGSFPQKVLVRSVKNNRQAHEIFIQDTSLATSEVVVPEGRTSYFDIARGKTLRRRRLAVVKARRCVIADALTKIALLAPPSTSARIARHYHAQMVVFK